MKRATKILTVVALATTPALANPTAKVPERWEAGPRAKVAVVMLEGQPYMVTAGTAPVPLALQEFGRYLGETAPLVGPDGRPGCGNVLGKVGPMDCEAFRTKAFEARAQTASKKKSSK